MAAFVFIWPAASAAPVRKQPPRTTGILVLDDCDPECLGKDNDQDNFTFLNSSGEQVFRVSGLNNCDSISSNHMIATDPVRLDRGVGGSSHPAA